MQASEQVEPEPNPLKERVLFIADKRARDAWGQYMKVSSANWKGLHPRIALEHVALFERLWVKAERDALRLRDRA